MNIADRIQNLRKVKGISQEELAEKAGVSRQAVSKWESAQSLPDIDKIMLMSEYFDVTTDYLLKGIEPIAQHPEEKANANIFVIVATALNFIGVITAGAIWYQEQVPMAMVIGLILMAVGCLVYGIGMIVSDAVTKVKAKRNFWTINIWFLSFLPLSFIYNILITHSPAPYPILANPVAAYPIFWAVYISVSLLVVIRMTRKKA